MYHLVTDIDGWLNSTAEIDLVDDEILFIMLGEESSKEVPKIIATLNKAEISFIGGIFPGIIYDEQRYEKGAIVARLPVIGKPQLVTGLDSADFRLPDLKNITDGFDKKYTAMILADGLTGNIDVFLNSLFNELADSVNYFGGGAGSITLKQQPCIFTDKGLFQDAAVVTFLRLQSHLGVHHGWERVMGPIVATKTDKNKIIELNWENAFEVYKEIVEKDADEVITGPNFFEIAKEYPFGMIKEYTEPVVRDLVAVGDNGELICVGNVPENSVLDILKGDAASLVEAAGQAADDCKPAKGKKITHSFIIDCISRVLFLGEKFSCELEEVKTKTIEIARDVVPVGMLTLGEISCYGEGFLEFFNKTIVVVMLHD